MRPIRTALVALCLCAPLTLFAQDYTKYDTVNNPKRYGTIWAPFYQKADELTAQTRAAFPHHLDIAFGESPKQRLDVYLPKNPVKNAPVLLFLHGGGFMEGDRAHYGYVATPYVQKGIITVVSGYRMAKRGVPYPAQSDDTKAAIVWIHKNIARFGGDPNKLFLSGHSVGATLSGDVSFDRSWMKKAGVPHDAIKGIAAISGDYDLSPGENVDYAPTPELEERASPLRHIVDPAPVAVIAAGTNEGKMRASSEDLEQRLRARGVKTRLLVMEGADHKDTVLALGDPNSPLAAAVLQMIGPAP
ncbi:MAG TPA: alpha/beta hydrolase [Steroidobacteraceae bacterium]|nr:alpha/beta hydrolase [Steroidobacteraceae bacterium]